MKKSFVLSIALIVLALLVVTAVVAGCGSSTTTTTATPATTATTMAPASTDTTAAPASTDTTAAPASTDTTAAAAYDIKAILAAIKVDPSLKAMLPAGNQSGGVVVASDIPYMPWEGFVGDTDQPTGFDYDLSQALAAKIGVPFKFTKVVFDSIILGIQAKKYDVSMSDMYDNADRQKVLDFVDYAEDTTAIITLKGNPNGLSDLNSLAGKSVGCEKGTTQAALLDTLNGQLKTAGKAQITIKQFPGQADALLALQGGTIVCDVTDRSTAFYNEETTMKNGQKVFELAVDPQNPNGYAPTPVGMGVLKGNTALLNTLQKALQGLIDDGVLQTIATHWGPVAVTSSQINQGK